VNLLLLPTHVIMLQSTVLQIWYYLLRSSSSEI